MDDKTFLRELTPEQRTRVYVHREAEWTVTKVLRRMTEHVREHDPWMQAIVRQLTMC